MKRVDLKAILRDPAKRRKLMIRTIIATQAREGITTTSEQAAAAYDKVMAESKSLNAAEIEAILHGSESLNAAEIEAILHREKSRNK